MTKNTLTEVVQSGDFIVLDTETTGLDSKAEVCQIAIVDSSGNVLLDTLVKPINPIPPEAERIHGISNADVMYAPKFIDVYEKLMGIILGRNVIIYNADYDVRVLQQSAAHGRHVFDVLCANWYCAMQAYAVHYGAWDDYHKSYTWQRLSNACQQKGLPVENAHTALADCLMTLALVKEVWGKAGSKLK